MNTTEAVRPTILFDIGLANFVDFIDVDTDSVVEQMRQRGLSNEGIASTTVMFSAEAMSRGYGKEEILTNGEYALADRTITLFVGTNYDIYKRRIAVNERARSSVSVPLEGLMGKHAEEDLNSTLRHEIVHRTDHEAMGAAAMVEVDREYASTVVSRLTRKTSTMIYLAGLGLAGMGAEVVELPKSHRPSFVEAVLAGTMALTWSSMYVANRLTRRQHNPTNTQLHKEYLSSPHEKGARGHTHEEIDEKSAKPLVTLTFRL